MQTVVYLLVVVAAAMASELRLQSCSDCTETASGNVVYVDMQQNPDVAARISLECGIGANKDRFALTVKALDTRTRLTRGWMQIQSGANRLDTTDQQGRQDWREEESMSVLTPSRTNDDCQPNCKAQSTGLVKIRQYIRVPSSSNLYFFGFVDVTISCIIAPEHPNTVFMPPAKLLPPVHLEQCRDFSHVLLLWSINPNDNTFSAIVKGAFPGAPAHLNWQLAACSLKPTDGGQALALIDSNGNVVASPYAVVSGVRRNHPTEYQFDFDLNAWPHGDAVLDCHIRVCSMSPTSNLVQQLGLKGLCPSEGNLGVAASGIRSVGADTRASSTDRRVTRVQAGAIQMFASAKGQPNPNVVCASSSQH